MELKKGDIVVYETEDVNWIIIFETWYEPYEGHMHYYALYDMGWNKMYIQGTGFLMEPDSLREVDDEEKQLLIDELKKEGYEWNGSKLNKI